MSDRALSHGASMCDEISYRADIARLLMNIRAVDASKAQDEFNEINHSLNTHGYHDLDHLESSKFNKLGNFDKLMALILVDNNIKFDNLCCTITKAQSSSIDVPKGRRRRGCARKVRSMTT